MFAAVATVTAAAVEHLVTPAFQYSRHSAGTSNTPSTLEHKYTSYRCVRVLVKFRRLVSAADCHPFSDIN